MRPTLDDPDEDWVDSFKAPVRRKYAKRPRKSRACELPAAEGNATVAEIFPNQASVLPDGGKTRSLCGYRMRTLAFDGTSRERSPVCVGDRVRVEAGVIVGRCTRRNRLIRSAPNPKDPLLHVIAANVDCLVVVAGAREPDFTAGIVDRFLVAAHSQGIRPILCVNKIDLLEPGEARPWSHYPSAGVAVVETSARRGRGMDGFSALLRGKTVVFCGHSGVGKTSLLRRLLADEDYGRVAAISHKSGKGRHTTSGAVLMPGPDGASLIDTPGVTSFGLIDIAPGGLLAHFPELHAAAAKCGVDCAHDEEPACGLRSLPRYASYRAILNSLD